MNDVNLTGRLTKAPDRPTVTESRRQVLDLRLTVKHHRRETVFVDVTCLGRRGQQSALSSDGEFQ